MFYETLLLIGAGGLAVMALLGFVQSGDADGDGDSDGDGDDADSPGVWAWISPIRLLSLALGAGAAGMLARSHFTSLWPTALLALLGAVLFDLGIVRPLWRVLMRFASKPASNLTGVIAQEATADSRFDETGRGIVRVTVDGHLTRLLATLDDPKARVNTGDRLLVTAIDSKRNTCQVTRL